MILSRAKKVRGSRQTLQRPPDFFRLRKTNCPGKKKFSAYSLRCRQVREDVCQHEEEDTIRKEDDRHNQAGNESGKEHG